MWMDYFGVLKLIELLHAYYIARKYVLLRLWPDVSSKGGVQFVNSNGSCQILICRIETSVSRMWLGIFYNDEMKMNLAL